MSPATLGNGTLPRGPLHIPEGDDSWGPVPSTKLHIQVPTASGLTAFAHYSCCASIVGLERIFHHSKLRLSVNPSREKPKWRSTNELLYPSGHRGPYFALGVLQRITECALIFVGHLPSDGIAMLRSDALAWHCRFESKLDNRISFSSAGCAQSAVAPAAISSSYDP